MMNPMEKAKRNSKLGTRNFYVKQKLMKKEHVLNESSGAKIISATDDNIQSSNSENWPFTKCNVVYVQCAHDETHENDCHETSNKEENADVIMEEIPEDECVTTNQLEENDINEDSTPITRSDFMDFYQSICMHIDTKVAEIKVPLVNRLVNLDAKILNIQKDVDELKTYVMEKRVLKENENIISLKKLVEIHQLSLPIQSLAKFEAFDEIIVDTLFNDMKTHFISSVNTNNDLQKICTNIFKAFFTRDVVVRFTAQKQIKEKKVFKKTKFYGCLKEALFHAFSGIKVIDDITLLHALGAVMNNAIDWDGFRAKRNRHFTDEINQMT